MTKIYTYITKDHYKHVSFSSIGSKLNVGGVLDIRNRDMQKRIRINFAKEKRSEFVYNICGAECYHDSQLSSHMEKTSTQITRYMYKRINYKPSTVNIYVKLSI